MFNGKNNQEIAQLKSKEFFATKKLANMDIYDRNVMY